MISDTFLFDVSSLFLSAWALTIAALCIAAFGHDLLPSRAAEQISRRFMGDTRTHR
jgi:hypothetical protein